MPKRVGIHWFRNDLRVQDNASLHYIAQKVDMLICIYFQRQVDSCEQVTELGNSELLGSHRHHFINQSLLCLANSLGELGQQLLIVQDANNKQAVLTSLMQEYSVTHLSAEWHSGFNEQQEWQTMVNELAELNTGIEFIQGSSSTLYHPEQFDFTLDAMPATFTPFRKKVEQHCAVNQVLPPLTALPLPVNAQHMGVFIDPRQLDAPVNYYTRLHGGERQALAQLRFYLWESNCIKRYKETRNGLDGWSFSSKLSAWLGLGNVSARQIYAELRSYEQSVVKNDSTYWLFFELLWREFFQWHQARHGKALFSASGVQGKPIQCNFDPLVFEQWKNGDTGYAIVDASMRQLKHTGFISNRARQLVASCLIHELNQHWRYGAKYFEYQLIDFDVASNWGNWQYLAGVGADPRGHRQFNLQKQTQQYDPNGEFIAVWTND